MNQSPIARAVEQISVESESDRRAANRFRTVCRIAKIARDDDVGLWRVSNISDRGMMLTAGVSVSKGESLRIALSETTEIQGKVVWSDSGRCGVAFDKEIDVVGLLKQLAAEQRAETYRPPRLELRMQAQALTAGIKRDIALVDMSQHGVGFINDGRVAVGSELELVLLGGLKRKAIVRWLRGGRGGLWLTQPLERADLESIQRFQG